MREMRGFTVIEMLVALTIFSMLLAVLMVGFRQGLSMWEKGQGSTVETQKLLVLHNALSQVFMQTVASEYHYKSGVVGVYFEGNKDLLKVMTAAPILSPVGVVCPVELRWRKKDGGKVLEYRQGNRGSDPGRGIVMKEGWQTLMSHLKHGAFFFEAPIYDPMGLLKNKLQAANNSLYRLKPALLESYDGLKLQVMPRRVLLLFDDSEGGRHRWLFNLRTSTSAFPESMYHQF